MPSQEQPGQAIVEYQLVVPNSDPVTLGPSVVTQRTSTIVETVLGPGYQEHEIACNQIDFVEKRIKQAMASGTPRLRIRLGCGTPLNMLWLPWQEHLITRYSATAESGGTQAGHYLQVETQDLTRMLSRGSRVISRKGSVSKIIQDIAASYQFKETVIETTKGEGIYVQTNESDSSFIRNRMVRRARNDKGRGNFLFYFRDNALHFHSPDFQPEIHDILYYQSGATALTLFDASQQVLDVGAAGTLMMVYDPYTGKVSEKKSDPAKSLRYADSLYDLASVENGALQIPYHTGTNPVDEAEIIGQNLYEYARSGALNLVLQVEKTIKIRHGDLVNLVVTPVNEKSSPWSGYYLVTEVKHAVINNAVTTNYRLSRGEIRKSLGNVTTSANDKILVSEQEAPGQDINIREAKSSQRTKGTGNSSVNGKLFVDVQQP